MPAAQGRPQGEAQHGSPRDPLPPPAGPRQALPHSGLQCGHRGPRKWWGSRLRRTTRCIKRTPLTTSHGCFYGGCLQQVPPVKPPHASLKETGAPHYWRSARRCCRRLPSIPRRRPNTVILAQGQAMKGMQQRPGLDIMGQAMMFCPKGNPGGRSDPVQAFNGNASPGQAMLGPCLRGASLRTGVFYPGAPRPFNPPAALHGKPWTGMALQYLAYHCLALHGLVRNGPPGAPWPGPPWPCKARPGQTWTDKHVWPSMARQGMARSCIAWPGKA